MTAGTESTERGLALYCPPVLHRNICACLVQVFLAIAVFLGDGGYMALKAIILACLQLWRQLWRHFAQRFKGDGMPVTSAQAAAADAARAPPLENEYTSIVRLPDSACMAQTRPRTENEVRHRISRSSGHVVHRQGRIASDDNEVQLARHSTTSVQEDLEAIQQRRTQVFLGECFPRCAS